MNYKNCNAIITGGTIPYNIAWNTSETTNQIIAAAGSYNILVTDDNGCISTKQILIIEPELLEIVNTSFIQATCFVCGIYILHVMSYNFVALN